MIKSTFSALQYRNFCFFWSGQCVSLMGTWMQRTALIWMAYSMTNSPFLVGLIGVCQFVPMFLFTLFAGVIVERHNKRKIILITQFLSMIQSIILTLLTYFGAVNYVHILILSTFLGIIQTFDMPARQSFLHEMVPKDSIMNAVSLNSAVVNLAKIVGPAVSGIVMVSMGLVYCFLLNSLSFFAVLIGLLLINVKSNNIKNIKDKNLIQEIKEGIVYIKNDEYLRFDTIFMAIICTFAMNMQVIVPVFTKEVLHMGGDVYTHLMSATGVGALFGDVFMSVRSKNGIKKSLFVFSMFMTSFVQAVMWFVSNYYIALLCVAIISFYNLAFMNMGNSIFQLKSKKEYKGRVMSVYAFLNQGSTPIGNFYAGSVMERFGGIWGFPSCGLISIVLLLLLFIFNKETINKWLYD
ncbi:MFS transporter [Pectinatus frisingensis]|uniref:MFS transporter n=1 Tax=Pectinatus frisingensis TaxID=865 RepID=UPI001E440FF4|nr:MFS transporter [Pectinatus frisingensis]